MLNLSYISPSIERLCGYTPQEVVGRALEQQMTFDSLLKLNETVAEGVSLAESSSALAWTRTLELELNCWDGSTVWTEVKISLLQGSDHHPAELLGVFRDISVRKQLEGELRLSQKMEAIGRLAGGVAHEFNNLLTSIIGYSEMGISLATEGDPLQEYFCEIRNGAERAGRLTGQLLTFSRQQTAERRPIELNQLILEVDRILRRLIGDNIELAVLVAENVGTVLADPNQVEQVLINLVINARDAMPTGGTITILTGRVSAADDQGRAHPDTEPGTFVVFSVNDVGSGIDEEIKEHIFDPFFTTKGIGKGSGLGLATSYGIVVQHGGYIEVDSEIGKGTTFSVYLPAVDETPLPSSKEAGPTTLPRGTEVVLLVEDQPAVRRVAAAILRQQGYTVVEALNGQDSLRVAHEHRYTKIDLLLSDVVMPLMGGWELPEKLRSIYPETKVLLTSGYTDDIIVDQGTSSSDIAFLPKPFTPAALSKKVREVLDR